MEASIEILSSSLVPLEDQPLQASCLRVYARVKVFQGHSHQTPFDSATISLYGAVLAEIGPRAATEKVSGMPSICEIPLIQSRSLKYPRRKDGQTLGRPAHAKNQPVLRASLI